MRKIRVIILIVVVLSSYVYALDFNIKSPQSFAIQAGKPFFNTEGPLNEYWQGDFFIEAHLDYALSPKLIAGVAFGYDKWSTDDTKFPLESQISAKTLMANIYYSLYNHNLKAIPGLGVGYTLLNYSNDDLNYKIQESGLVVQPGLILCYPLTDNLDLFANPSYRIIFESFGTDFHDESSTMNTFNIGVGLQYYFNH